MTYTRKAQEGTILQCDGVIRGRWGTIPIDRRMEVEKVWYHYSVGIAYLDGTIGSITLYQLLCERRLEG